MNTFRSVREQPMPSPHNALGVLSRELHVRVLNCSSSGCLLETSAQLPVGTVGSLSLQIGSTELLDDVRVVRCQPIAGSGALFHVGLEFLWTAVPGARSLRLAMQAAPVQSDGGEIGVAT